MNDTAVNNQKEIVYPRGRRWSGPWRVNLLPVLIPASWLYQGVASAARQTRSIDAGSTPAGTRVISVGNLEVGGNGKTPLSIHLLEKITARGGTPVYVSRGFRSVAERINAITVVAPENGETAPLFPGTRHLHRGSRPKDLPREIGDEGAMIAARLPEIPLLFSRHKRRALSYAADQLGATHVVLDDAFQSWGVPRDLDVVLLDAARPFGNGWLLPAGTLREPPEALERADILGFNGVKEPEALERAANAVFRTTGLCGSSRKPVFGIRRTVELTGGGEGLQPGSTERCAAVSGIGAPEPFERGLFDAGVSLAAAFRYPDHYDYGREDVDWIRREVERRGIGRVIVTEKDWVKFQALNPEDLPLAVARLRIEIFGDDPLEGFL